jgi:chromosome segregation ATPase
VIWHYSINILGGSLCELNIFLGRINMSNDDLTQKLTNADQEDNTTQATITAVFRLVREVQDGQKGLNSRIDALESRIAEMSDEMKAGFLRLSDKLCDRIDRSRLHAESDYEDLLRRLRKLESKAS